MDHEIQVTLQPAAPRGSEIVDGQSLHAINCPGRMSAKIMSPGINTPKRARAAILFLLLTILLFSSAAAASSYQYIRLGKSADSVAIPGGRYGDDGRWQ